MLSLDRLLAALTLLVLTVESENVLKSLKDALDRHDILELPDAFDLLDAMQDAPVSHAEKVVRPLRSLRSAYGPISHSGVRVTLEDGSQLLIQKQPNDSGAGSAMAVTSAEHMSPQWKTEEARAINGRRTVGDFVRAGGDAYDARHANCHHAADAMMKL